MQETYDSTHSLQTHSVQTLDDNHGMNVQEEEEAHNHEITSITTLKSEIFASNPDKVKILIPRPAIKGRILFSESGLPIYLKERLLEQRPYKNQIKKLIEAPSSLIFDNESPLCCSQVHFSHGYFGHHLNLVCTQFCVC